MCSNAIKKVLCLIICFIFWFYAMPCFASNNDEQAITLLQQNLPDNIIIDNLQQVDVINDSVEERLAIRANNLRTIQELRHIVVDHIRNGGDIQELRPIITNLIPLLRMVIENDENLLHQHQLNNEQSEELQRSHEARQRSLQQLVNHNADLERQIVIIAAMNDNLEATTTRLEEGNPPCHCLELIDQAISSSTCHCVNPDLAHRLPRKFWYGVASGVVVTSIGLTILYHFI